MRLESVLKLQLLVEFGLQTNWHPASYAPMLLSYNISALDLQLRMPTFFDRARLLPVPLPLG